MFGLFKSKKLPFSCPMCGAKYDAKLNPEEFTDFSYPHADGAYVSKSKCPFCKTEMTILMGKNKTLFAIDEKWQVIENKYEAESDALNDELCKLEEELEEKPDDSRLKKELARVEAAIKKLDTAFEKKEDKYSERQMNWDEKYQEKFGS